MALIMGNLVENLIDKDILHSESDLRAINKTKLDNMHRLNINIDKLTRGTCYVINEIFNKLSYKFIINESCIVLDIGGNIGLASLFFASDTNVKKNYSFEPYTPSYNEAIRNFSNNKHFLGKINIKNYGLSDKDESLYLSYNALSKGCQSTVIDRNKNKDNLPKEGFVLKTASDVIKKIINKHSNQKIVVKIDTEGSEYKILRNLSKENLLKNIDILLIEWHYILGLEEHSQILIDILLNSGFNIFANGEPFEQDFTKLNKDIAGMLYCVKTSNIIHNNKSIFKVLVNYFKQFFTKL